MLFSSIFGFKKPEATDAATVRQEIGFNAQLAEDALKSSVALQNNASGTAYTSAFPLAAYVDEHAFVFIPLITNTGAVTVNFNSLGVKNVYNAAGTVQLSVAGDLIAFTAYLLTYDSGIAGGGGFKAQAVNQPTIKSGAVTYSESLAANTSITKSIAIGNGKMRGMAVIGSKIIVHFGTDSAISKFSGFVALDSSSDGRAWIGETDSYLSGGFVTIKGYQACGDAAIKITAIKINGTNIDITFKNDNLTTAKNISTTINWEVW